MMLYQCDICGEKDIIENADFVHIGGIVLCKCCYGKIVKNEAIDEALKIIEKHIEWCGKNYSLGEFMPDVYALTLVKQDIKTLKGGKQENEING